MPTFEHYAVVIPDEHLLVAFHHEQASVPDEMICTIGLDCNDAAPLLADLELVADAWADEIVTPLLSVDQSLVRVTFSNADGVLHSIDRSDAGTEALAMSPVSNAVIVEKRSSLAGRRNRGRLYLPAVIETEVGSNGVISTTLRDGVNLDFANFLAAVEAIAGATYELVILHSKGWDGGVEPADPGNAPVPTLITSFYARSLIGTQRRRLR